MPKQRLRSDLAARFRPSIFLYFVCPTMVSALVSRLMLLTAGTLYPAYRSYKAVKTKNVREYVKWMMYWIVLALFLTVETFTDIFVAFWLPFYYEIKILFLIWLLSPYTKGASVLYRRFIHPVLEKHEEDIDLYLEGAKNQGYTALVRFGSRGVNYAKEIMAAAAVKGQAQLINQIVKSYSLNDVTDAVNAPVDINRSHSLSENMAGPSHLDAQDMIDQEFGYLDNDLDDEPLSVRIKRQTPTTASKSGPSKQGTSKDDGIKPRSRRVKNSDVVDAYATLPRRTTRAVVSKQAQHTKQP